MVFDDKLGLAFVVVGASISLLCVAGILLYTVIRRLRGKRYGSDVSDSNLFLNLMVADLIHAIGTMFNIKWAADGAITQGVVCTTQGILIQIGNVGISFMSTGITVYTFMVLVLYWTPKEDASTWIIGIIWMCTGLVVFIPQAIYKPDVYYGVTDLWCWINSQYMVERLLTDYVWVWLTGLIMAILYPIVALTICGLARGSIHETAHTAVAKKLLLYPVIYIICVLPNSISRWLSFTSYNVPHRVILAACSIRALSGFFNLLVFSITRPAIVFRSWGEISQRGPFARISTLRFRNATPISSQHNTSDYSFHAQRPVISEG